MLVAVAAPPLPRMGPGGEGAEPPPRRDWLELYGRLVGTPPPPNPRLGLFVAPPSPSADADDENAPSTPSPPSELQQRLPDEVLLHVLSRLGGADAPYALARVALVCRHFRLLASAPCLWERAAWRAFTAPAFQAGLGRRAQAEAQAQAEAEEERRRRWTEEQHQQQQGSVQAVAHAVWAAPAPTAAPPARQDRRPASLPPAPPAAAAFASGPAAVQRLLATKHRGSWRHLYLSTPRPRTDGVYVSRNTYVRVGARELRSASGSQTCHLVAYFRYWLFLPSSGALVYRTSPLPPYRVAKGLAQLAAAVERASGVGGGGWAAAADDDAWGDEELPPQAAPSSSSSNKMQQRPQQQSQQQHALVGRHAVRGADVLCAVAYPNSRRTEIRTRLALRSSGAEGSWNRVDVRTIESFDREDGTRSALDGGGGDRNNGAHEEEEDDADDALWQAALGVEAARGLSPEARRAHRRGLNPGVFVPWGEVMTTRLNDPPSKMDVFIPG
jgi:hypothetical protein